MEGLSAYLAQDRHQALGAGRALSERAEGVALFADVSGFTSLTEALSNRLGHRRGAEELSTHLNSVYETLIQEVHRYGGSVVAFAGDAITCWFDQDDGRRAATAAANMQEGMKQFGEIRVGDNEVRSLAVKIGLAAGPVRRFLVGHEHIHLLDVIAGRTLTRMADATGTGHQHEIVLTSELATSLSAHLVIREWRTGTETGESLAVIEKWHGSAPVSEWPQAPGLPAEVLRAHLLHPVFERLQAGQGEFLTELRPGVALFLKFEGIDYDEDPSAGEKLNAYIQWVQEITEKYGGFLLAVGVGDKGSYLYCCFGAPVTHENSAWRAVMAGHDLRLPPPHLGFIKTTQIGINSGTFRTGAYGSAVRRTYGVLGDPVNLAARLMQHAAPGQVLVSDEVRRQTGNSFAWQGFAPIKAKGKSGLIKVLALLGPAAESATGFVEPQYALPLIGRTEELGRVETLLAEVLDGRGKVLRIRAEAGLGKSRLVAEAVRLAREKGVEVHVGQCVSHGRNTSYLPWQSIWTGLFQFKGEPEDIGRLKKRLEGYDKSLVTRLPLLSAVLNTSLPENEVTALMEARLRKASLEALLSESLRGAAADKALLLVIEDCHWIDSLSADLLAVLARGIRHSPVLLIYTDRPPEPGIVFGAEMEALPQFSSMELTAFSREEAVNLIQLKLKKLFNYSQAPPLPLLERLMEKSQGNPFYLEELLNFLKDQRPDFKKEEELENLELPASLHTLILSRIDRLTAAEQSTLKMASVIGRLFQAAILWGLRRDSSPREVEAALEALCRADLTMLDRPEPEAAYIFKHVITQEVAYESLPHSTRERLHEQIGLCLEQVYRERIDQKLDLLAFHFDRSPNLEKKRDYLLRAGEAAQARYANDAAISYYERALPQLEGAGRVETYLKLGKVFELVGEWKKSGACYQRAFEGAEHLQDRQAQGRCQAATADLLRKQGMFPEAENWFGIAQTAFEEIGDQAGLGQALHGAGTVAAMQGEYEKAIALYRRSLSFRRSLGEKAQTAALLNNLGIIARFQAHYDESRELLEQSLVLRREVGDRWAVANSLNNIGVLFRDMGMPALARPQLEESLLLNRQVGDRWAVANVLSSLGEVAADLKDWGAAAKLLEESLEMNLELADRTAMAFIIETFAAIAVGLNRPEDALRLLGAASGLRNTIGAPLSPGERQNLEKRLSSAKAALAAEVQAACVAEGECWSIEQTARRAGEIAREAIEGVKRL